VTYMLNKLDDFYVERSKELNSLCNHLLDIEKGNPLRTTVALLGPGGYGKTIHAHSFCHIKKVRNIYCDGILCVELGLNPNIEEQLKKLYHLLTGDDRKFLNEGEAEQYLSDKFEELKKTYLLVIDDVWKYEHLEPFLRISRNCSRLITTRLLDVATQSKSTIVNVEEMGLEEASKILWASLDEKPVNLKPFERLAERLSRMPLLLRLAGAILRKESLNCPLDKALNDLNKEFDRIGIKIFNKNTEEHLNSEVAKCIDVSIKYLMVEEKQDIRPFIQLGVIPNGAEIPISIVSALWQKDIHFTEKLCKKLRDFSLIKYQPGDQTESFVFIQKIIHDYLTKRLGFEEEDTMKLNDRIADALFSQQNEDEYKMKYLLEHLIEAHRWDNIREIFGNISFLRTGKLRKNSCNSNET